MSELSVERVRTLEKIICMLETVCSRLEYLREPVTELLSYLSESEETGGFQFLRSCVALCGEGSMLRDAWKLSLEKYPPEALKKSDTELLLRIGGTLGASEISGQLGELRLCREMLDERLKTAEKHRDACAKLYPCLGISAGITAMLIII